MFSKNFKFENFRNIKKAHKNLEKKYREIINQNYRFKNLIKSFSKNYQNSYTKQDLRKFKNYKSYSIYGMGGSSLGIQAIYDFLRHKIKKNFYFLDNLSDNKKKIVKNKNLNIIISKSGNTLETIVNQNIFSGKKNIFITENTNNYLRKIALKTRSDIIEHKNYIGGRYSVLSEVGMLPAELMGLNTRKFKQFDALASNKKFIKSILENVNSIYSLISRGKTNLVLINYDQSLNNLLKWYQQLIAESLGKKAKGIFPIISEMPKDNHSIMQLFLDGKKNNIFTFFDSREKNSTKIKTNRLLEEFSFLSKKNINLIKSAQKNATKRVFAKKNFPFRSFEIDIKNETCLGELFTFFMIETILLGKLLNIDPFNQPAVELIKIETKKILKNSVYQKRF